MSRRRMLAAIILVVALGARVGYVAATPGYVPIHDDHQYDQLALGIVHNGDFPVDDHRPTAYRPPGYPYVLAGVYAVAGTGNDRVTIARYVQTLEGTAIVALLGLLALWLMGPLAALCTMAVAALYIPLVTVGAALLSEPQFAALTIAALLCVLAYRRAGGGWRWVILTGVLGGVASLTRSNGLVVLLALAGGLWIGRPRLSRRALAPVLAMLATSILVIAPWTIRNAVIFHTFIPVTDEQGGTLAGTYNPVSASDPVAPASWHLLAQIPEYYSRSLAVAARPEPELQSTLTRLALRYIGNHPFYVFEVGFYNGLRLLDLGGLARVDFTAMSSGITSAGVADSGAICFWIVGLLAIVGLASRRVRRAIPRFVWLAAGLILVSILFVNTESPRFRVPLDPFFILLAGGGLATIGEALARRRAGAHQAPPEPAGQT